MKGVGSRIHTRVARPVRSLLIATTREHRLLGTDTTRPAYPGIVKSVR